MEVKPIYSLSALIKYFLKLGSTGFGGPVALVACMHKVPGGEPAMDIKGRIQTGTCIGPVNA